MRILIWATHLQTDILALACHLDRRPDVELLIVSPNTGTFLRTPFSRARPFAAPLLDRDDPATRRQVLAFAADVAVADNHVPPPGSAPRLFYMWHGMGWKARSRLDLEIFYREVRRMIGADPRTGTPNFLAQCYGPTDFEWRVKNWRLPHSACVIVGMAFADLLLDPPYAKRDFADDYEIDISGRKTVLLSITWHYGGIFARAPGLRRTFGLSDRAQSESRDADFLDCIIDAVDRLDANLLICLHDRRRYDPRFLVWIEDLANRHAFVELRFKSDHPDNMTDLLVADVMLSNLSSFLAYFYVLGRPAVHILPAESDSPRIERMIMLFSRFRLRIGVRKEKAWMLHPHDTGGPIVANGDEAVRALELALIFPERSNAAPGRWLQRHIPLTDGHACERIEACLRGLCRGGGEAGAAQSRTRAAC